MSAIADVLKAVRETIVINERVASLTVRMDALAARQERMLADHAALRDRMIRMEAFFEILRPVLLQQTLPGPGRD